MGKKDTETRAVKWTASSARKLLAEQEASGLPLSEFARSRDIDAQRLYARRRRLRASEATTAPAFVAVRVAPGPAVATDRLAIELVLRGGWALRVPPDFDPSHVRWLIALLEEVPSC